MDKTHGIKKQVVLLRGKGKTYTEIKKIVGITIPKSTLSYWCKDVLLSKTQASRIERLSQDILKRGRKKAFEMNKIKRQKHLDSLRKNVQHLEKSIYDKDTAKIALAMLYLAEGGKSGGSIMFGNSDPLIIKLFLRLLRLCYIIDEAKFRCTLQCRADQDTKTLEKFWSQLTSIPLSQFYKVQVDKRTIGKPSKKADYKGVCRIDYFSADIYNELKIIGNLLAK